jgi:electron transfer flavoprotein alpha subunit
MDLIERYLLAVISPICEQRMFDPTSMTDSTASSAEPGAQDFERGSIALLACEDDDHTWELLGDARDLAERLAVQVTVLTFRSDARHAQELIDRGADVVTLVELNRPGALPLEQPFCANSTRLVAVEGWYRIVPPRLLFVAACGDGRQFAARLAARCEVELLSPALCVQVRARRLDVTALHPDGRRARQVDLQDNQAAILVLNKGVGQPRPPDTSRSGSIRRLIVSAQPEPIESAKFVAADPAVADIQHLPRLVAGGHGIGGREGFELLRSVARRLKAGVAASRVAVDLGWIERERQVGQSGKTVRPELYIACGISGSSHHLEGMSQSRHVIAINTDPQAPIFKVAHLGLVADWRETLLKLDSMLATTATDAQRHTETDVVTD